MSQYISSFLIDPVVRQARRFSRPTVDIPQVTGLRPSLASNEEPPRPDPFPTAAMRATQEDLPRMRISTQMFPSITLSDGPEVIVPATLERPRERELQAVSDGRTSLQLVEMGSLEPAVNARRYTLTYIEDVSRNPPTGIHNGGGSTTSSLNGSGLMDVNMTPAESPRQSLLINAQDARGRGDTGSSQADDGFLPADDGMGPMRRRIIAIQRTDSSYKEKARLVHGLMTEKHNSSQQSLHGPQFPRAHSPGSLHCSERPWTPSSPKSMDSSMPTVSPPTSSSSYGDAPNPFHLSPDDLKPTYYEKKAMVSSDADQEGTAIETEETSKALGCAHYKRNIKLQCSACSRWYTCRFCHDAVEDHMLNRRETKNMLCMLCGCAQPASQECAMCSKRGAWYYCDICKLWDDDLQKHIYHCNDCGICRLGQGLGKDFFHCKTCCVCMSISIKDTHRCIERSTDCDCPICGEYMFTSPQTVVSMRCGHSIHHRCYSEHMKSSYKCPICSRSIINTEMEFRHLERAIEMQPMPPEFQDTKAWVYCNDCSAKTSVKYHWLGLKCAVCDSYNTAQLQILSGPDPEAEPARTSDVHPGTESPSGVSRANSRGRSRRPTTISRRPTTSAPPSAALQGLLGSATWPEIRGRTAHSMAPDTVLFAMPSDSNSDAEDSMDTDEDEESEVEFWGGESPRSRHASPSQAHEMVIDGSSEDEDDDDSEDEEMSDEAEDDEADEYNRMEIFGHR